MSRYLLRRTDQKGGYVAKAGSEHSYTNRIQDAWLYKSREEAERDRCKENEHVVLLFDVLSEGI